MVEIKSTKNASRVSDRDPTASILMRVIVHATWLHLKRRSAIQQPRLNGNDLHPMCFVRAVDRRLNGDQTVTHKLSYKLRCSSRL